MYERFYIYYFIDKDTTNVIILNTYFIYEMIKAMITVAECIYVTDGTSNYRGCCVTEG